MAGIYAIADLPVIERTLTRGTIKAIKISKKLEELSDMSSEDDKIKTIRKLIKEREPPSVKTEILPTERCLARIYTKKGSADQCKKKKMDKLDFCKFHNEQNLVMSKPCSFNDKGERIGLFFGRVDEPIPYLSADNDKFIAINWKDSNKDLIQRSQLEGKTFRPDSDIPGKIRSKETKTGAYETSFDYYYEENLVNFVEANPGIKMGGLRKIAKTIYARLEDKSKYEKMLEEKKPRKIETKKPSKKTPKQSKNAYMLFSDKIRGEIKTEHPTWGISEISVEISKRWRKLPETGPESVETYKKLAMDEKAVFLTEHPELIKEKKPKGPMNAFIIFSNEIRETVRSENPTLKGIEIQTEISKKWKLLSDEKVEEYKQKAIKCKEEFLIEHPELIKEKKSKKEKVKEEGEKVNTTEEITISEEVKLTEKKSIPKTLSSEIEIISKERFGKTGWLRLCKDIDDITGDHQVAIDVDNIEYSLDNKYNIYNPSNIKKVIGKLVFDEKKSELQVISV